MKVFNIWPLFYHHLPIVSLQQQEVWGLVQGVPHASSSLTALLFPPSAGDRLTFSAPEGPRQGGIIPLRLLSHSQLHKCIQNLRQEIYEKIAINHSDRKLHLVEAGLTEAAAQR